MSEMREREFDDEPEVEEGGEVEDLISAIEDDFHDYLANPEIADLLNQIFDKARASYEKDEKGWNNFFEDLRSELIASDDEDNLKEILAHRLKKAKLELS